MAEVELQIPARPDYLALVRRVVGAVLDLDPALEVARRDDLQLAVTEACANAIEATGARALDGPILVRCALEPDRIEVEITDRGGGFDPADVETLPSVTDPRRLRHERGLGIPLMRDAVDEVHFAPAPGGTSVRLTLYRTRR